jgi:hypothetical protein
MSLMGQNPKLPPCNMHGCFSSNSGHASQKAQALPYSSNLCWGLVFAGIPIPIAFADSAAPRILELVHEISPGGLASLQVCAGRLAPISKMTPPARRRPVVVGRRCCQSQASGAMSST